MKTQQLSPIIFIHGIAGSKLWAQNRQTKQQSLAWITPSQKAVDNVAQYLWGDMDQEEGIFKSYVDEWCAIESVKGIKGCDYLLNKPVFKNISCYFGNMQKQLAKDFGYKIDETMFAFTYDWRQSVSLQQIQQEFRNLIKEIKQKTGQRVTVIPHSLGGILVECYQKLFDDWQEDISSIISLFVPYDGASTYVLTTQLLGYNLKLPIGQVIAKGSQFNSGSLQFLYQSPSEKNPLQSCLFVCKSNDEGIVNSPINTSMASVNFNKYSQLNQNHIIYQNIVLNQDVYGKAVPDVAFGIACKIMNEQSLGEEYLLDIFLKLQKCCKYKAIGIKCKNCIYYGPRLCKKQLVNKVFEKEYENNEKVEYQYQNCQWEIYLPWIEDQQIDCRSDRKFGFQNNKFVQFNTETQQLQYSEDFLKLQKQNIFQNTVKQSEFPDLFDFCVAQQYYDTFNTNKANFLTSKQLCQFQQKSLFQLIKQSHPDKTMDRVMFNPAASNYKVAQQVRNKQRKFLDQQKYPFLFYSFSGSGFKTPLHAIYKKPIQSYNQLLNQKPDYLFSNGDNTVCLCQALADGYPDVYLGDRVILPRFHHFCGLKSDAMYQQIKLIISKQLKQTSDI